MADIGSAVAWSDIEGPDLWANRASRMCCVHCMYYVPKQGEKVGRCRRRAPTMKGFPVVFPADWCGEHKLNEAVV